jgi:hypothetical protein
MPPLANTTSPPPLFTKAPQLIATKYIYKVIKNKGIFRNNNNNISSPRRFD